MSRERSERSQEPAHDPGEIKTAVQLALPIVIRARNVKASSAKNPRPYSEASAKYDLRVFLLRLGANG